jgi:membrane protein DedA with SNARE-associated domain
MTELLGTYGLLAIFVIMLLKESGVPLPIPSDLVTITAGIQAAAGSFSLVELVVALEVAIVVGGSVQFLAARAAGRPLVVRVGRRVGLTESRLDQALAAVQRRGPLAIFLGLNIPAGRAGIVIAAGCAGISYAALLPAMVAGSTVFYGWHVALGFITGPAALGLLDVLNLPLAAALVGLAAVGLVAWLIIGRARRAGAPEADVIDRLHTWTEAACPACLAITAIEKARG